MNFWKSVSGMLTVEFTGAEPEKTLEAIVQAKIPVSHVVRKEPLSCQARILSRDYYKLDGILQRRGDRLIIIKRLGIFWEMKAFFRRPVLLLLFLLLLFFSFYLPTRVLFITVEGNECLADRLILSAAEQCGISFGASRKLVRSEKVKNELLSALPQLQWAGINTSGCTAVISVQERIEEEVPAQANIVSNIVADRDGYILSATITGGSGHIKAGDTVTKGQMMVSGYTDCGICIRATRAQGEIWAQTNRKMTTVIPQTYLLPAAIQEEKYKISLLLGKKRLNLWKDSRISDVGCGRMYSEHYFSLPGGFRLPIAICFDRYSIYELQETEISADYAQHMLKQFQEYYLFQQMVAGQITKKQQMFSCTSGVCRMEGNYVCTEMIGIEQREQNGVINGKRN